MEQSRGELTESGPSDDRLRAEVDAELERVAEVDRAVPAGLQIAAGWAWRVLLVAALVLGIGWVLGRLSSVTIPLAIGIMLTAGLAPVASRLTKWGVPRPLAAVLTLVGGLLLVTGMLTLIISQIASQSEQLGNSAMDGFQQLMAWLNSGPLRISQDQINGWLQQLTDYLRHQQSTIATYAASGAGAVGNFLAGLVLAIFGMFFMLYDGPMVWRWLLKLAPRASRTRIDRGGQAGWHSLVEYVRATIVVAAVDAIGPLIAALIMGVPMAPALAALLFLTAFVPIVGVLVGGAVVILVTLVTVGPVQALIMLGVIIAVNQLEGNVLQPLLLGKAVALHPLAIVFGITIGISLGGIVGALLVVPIMAFGKSFISAVSSGDAKEPRKPEEPEETGDTEETGAIEAPPTPA